MPAIEENQQKAQEYLDKLIGTPYSWWTGGKVPDGAPAWARNGKVPPAADVRGTSCFCAGVANLARRAVDLEIPTLGNADYDGGVVAYFGATDAAPADFPRTGYFERHGRLRRFDLEAARRPWTLIGRKYRNVKDQGHVAIVIPGGKVLQSYDAGGGKPGVNTNVTLERSHANGYYEVMVRAEDWLLPFDAEREEPPAAQERPKAKEKKPAEPKPKVKKLPEPEPEELEIMLFTAKQFIEIAENPHLDLATAEKYRKALVPEMREAGITTPLRMAAFFGNVMVETDRGNTLEEYGDRNYWLYLDRNSGRAGEWRYHGRGFLMNTWRAAYARLSEVLGEDLVSNPDLLTRPDLAAKAATWFWTQHDLNSYADKSNFKAVAAIINTGRADGAPNHLTERLHFYDRAKRVLASGAGVPSKSLDRNGFNQDGLPYINIAAVGQADETAAFALATEIRRAGIGVSVTTGAEQVYALAKKIRPEPIGYRQMWILGQPALDACGDYRELANWPVSSKTDYYDLAGKDFSGTCRRAAELADEKAREGVGQRFLDEMEDARDPEKPASRRPARLAAPPPAEADGEPEGIREEPEEDDDGGRRKERVETLELEGIEIERAEIEGVEIEGAEVEKAKVEVAVDQEPSKRKTRRKREEDPRDDKNGEPDGFEPVETFTAEDLRGVDLEEIGREALRFFSRIRSYAEHGNASQGDSETHVEKEED